MDAQTCSFQHGAEEGLRGAFAIGARDMNHRRQFLFRVIQPLQDALHAIQAEINDLRMQREKPRQNGITDSHGSGGNQRG